MKSLNKILIKENIGNYYNKYCTISKMHEDQLFKLNNYKTYK